MVEEERLSLEEASHRYQVSVATLRRKIRCGEISGATRARGRHGSEWRVTTAALEALGYEAVDELSGASFSKVDELERTVQRLIAALVAERARLQALDRELGERLMEAAKAYAELQAQFEAHQLAEPDFEHHRKAPGGSGHDSPAP